MGQWCAALAHVVVTGGWAGRRVLVTGHTGFKGSWLCTWLLSRGARVSGLALEPEPGPSLFEAMRLRECIDHAVVDVRHPALVAERVAEVDPEVTFHLAAQSLVRRSYAEPESTWQVNLNGTIAVMSALTELPGERVAVIVTTDKVYADDPSVFAYREADRLGGRDPYSASKAAAELACASWRHLASTQSPGLRMAAARAGNVIGGGDWAVDRLIPDFVRARLAGTALTIRRPTAIRPWQHVLEPLSGYLRLAEHLGEHLGLPGAQEGVEGRPTEVGAIPPDGNATTGDAPVPPRSIPAAVNFGPDPSARRQVSEVLTLAERHWPGPATVIVPDGPVETATLWLSSDLARGELGWAPRWDLPRALAMTLSWYQRVAEGADAMAVTREQIAAYESSPPLAAGSQ